MSKILSIETSTVVCSVAIHNNGQLIDFIEISEPNAHSSKLTVLIEELLNKNSIMVADLSAIAISQGPGSYTGLRIGASVAKGFCYACNIPLIAIDTLEALTLHAQKNLIEEGINISNSLFYPMIDARRMEVYTAEYSDTLVCNKTTYALVVDEDTIHSFESQNTYYLFGDGSDKLQETLTGKQIHYLTNVYTTARTIGELAFKKFSKKDFSNVAYFEPFYLKEFQTTTPKKNILG